MSRPIEIPIRTRVIAAILLVCGCALLAAAVALFIVDTWSARSHLVDDLELIARAARAHCIHAVMERDPQQLERSLDFLRRNPRFVEIAIFLPDGSLFYHWKSHAETLEENLAKQAADLTGDSYEWLQPLTAGGQAFGSLLLRAQPVPIIQRLWTYGRTGVLVMLLAVGLALPLASTISQRIVSPLERLAAIAERVEREGDCSLRIGSYPPRRNRGVGAGLRQDARTHRRARERTEPLPGRTRAPSRGAHGGPPAGQGSRGVRQPRQE
ncbi:MAG: CHASE sensor domain-containing protein [Acidobacteriota bacterium]|nr:CHASE sensor domain-containing protein [Acidobacteriota bacterium]